MTPEQTVLPLWPADESPAVTCGRTEPVTLIRRTLRRYVDTHSEYAALQVVARGLFLSVVLVIAFLFVLTFVTSLISGQNEIVIPINGVDSSVDLGAIIQSIFSRASTSVITVTGALTFLISAFLTSKALRDGSRRAVLGADAPKSRWTDLWTWALALGLSCLVLATWLLAMATTLRRAAWSALFGADLNDGVVNTTKAICIVLSAVLIAVVIAVVHRTISGGWLNGRGLLTIALMAGIVVAANFFLLYTYLSALANPAASAGIVLVFTIMLWVNIVVRVYLGGLCLIATQAPPAR